MPSEILVATLIVCGHALGLVAEFRLHEKNLAVLEEHGGQLRSITLMKALYVVWALLVPGIVAVGLFSHSAPSKLWQAVGVGLVGISQLFRRWAIHSLGAYWTMGIVELHGLRPLNTGPYRIFKNPEYSSRLVELVGVGLATSAWGSTGVGAAVFAVLLLKARAQEEALLYGTNLAPKASIE